MRFPELRVLQIDTEERGPMPVKGKGKMIAYFLVGRKVVRPVPPVESLGSVAQAVERPLVSTLQRSKVE